MDGFTMNGYSWRVCYVDADDPMLVDRTGRVTVATTDPGTLTVYILRDLDGAFLTRVLIHELGHCAMFSFGLLDDIHRMVHPRYWLEAEEWVCNFIADYGMTIFDTAYAILGDRAIAVVPYEVERLVA
jgi:hypothetical protein